MWVQKGEDKGIWTELVNEITGESSLKEHKPKVIWKSCKQGTCTYEITSDRELTCTKCKRIVKFTPGKDNKFLKEQGLI